LYDQQLATLAASGEMTFPESHAPLPTPISGTQASLPAALVPAKLSASAYQSFLNCPYQFYALYGLNLSPIKEITEDMEKKDYGEFVHRILEAFHTTRSDLPGPFAQELTPDNKAKAQQLLDQISDVVFANALECNYLAKGWLIRWKKTIPAYLDWIIKRRQSWQPFGSEQRIRQSLAINGDRIDLIGRLDQIDQKDDHFSIIDYKTGAVPSLQEVETAEHIQLPFYVLLLNQPVEQALFLSLDNEKISDKVHLDGNQLSVLTEHLREQLAHSYKALKQGTVLRAQGDTDVCSFCQAEGLCRRGLWAKQ
ncbi:MAG: PD-(D/E)XK nuclease family protein, partial [Gammaproteobacteria bacterium]|nr:PD-(D/E)XK nuclease family protein [Gammaproteobacteria bacterium]